jgi:hypothetical protein
MTLLVVVAAASLAVMAPADGFAARRPSLSFAPDTPQDVEALARRTWVLFTDAFAARWDCLDGMTVRGAWRLTDRAEYEPDQRLATVRIPGAAPNLQASLVHEFAHHLEFSCPDIAGLRHRFLAAQGLAPTTPWFSGASWDRIPSEQFAEAAVVAVLGRTAHVRTYTSPAAVRAIRAWGQGA